MRLKKVKEDDLSIFECDAKALAIRIRIGLGITYPEDYEETEEDRYRKNFEKYATSYMVERINGDISIRKDFSIEDIKNNGIDGIYVLGRKGE